MTGLWRAGLMIGFLTALLGAPASVLGSSPDSLSEGTVSATSGSVSTLFSFGVRYASPAGNAAGSVTVLVAGRTLAMERLSGNAMRGSYSVRTTLPMGSWTPRFLAHPPSGTKPFLDGPRLLVSASAPTWTPRPSASPVPGTVLPKAPVLTDVIGPAPQRPPAAPAATAIPMSAVALVAPAPAQTAHKAPLASPKPDVATPRPPAEPAGNGSAAPAPAAGPTATQRAGVAAPATSPSAGERASRTPAPASAMPPFGAMGSSLAVIVLVAFGVGSIALTGVAWMLRARRRRVEDDGEPLAIGQLGSAAAATSAERVAERMLGRAAMRSRLDPSDDPIVAAMGLPHRRDARPRFKSEQGQVDEPHDEPAPSARRGRPSR